MDQQNNQKYSLNIIDNKWAKMWGFLRILHKPDLQIPEITEHLSFDFFQWSDGTNGFSQSSLQLHLI